MKKNQKAKKTQRLALAIWMENGISYPKKQQYQ